MHDIRQFLSKMFNEPGALLYIGARVDAHSWLDELIAAGNDVSIIEVWPDNVIELSKVYDNVALMDVRDVTKEYDYIFYWHGPEHLPEDEIIPVLDNLKSKCKMLAVACPYGVYPQGAHNGNPYEEHKTYIYPNFFIDLGYTVKTDGIENAAGSEIVAYI